MIAPLVGTVALAFLTGLAAPSPRAERWRILTPGLHDREHSPRSIAGAWWAPCPDGGAARSRLLPVRVTVGATVTHPYGADYGLLREIRVAGLGGDGCTEPPFLVRGPIPAAADPARTGTIPDRTQSTRAENEGSDQATFSGRPLSVRGDRRGGGYTLELVYDGRRQTIYRAATAEHEAWEGWEVVWVGDLDGDGAPDLVVDASDEEYLRSTRLYLSSAAKTGEMVRQVARFDVTLDC